MLARLGARPRSAWTASPFESARSARSYSPRIVAVVTSSFSSPMPVRSTLPSPSGQPSPSASICSTTQCMPRTANGYSWSRRPLSPLQRHASASALGNLAVSSVLPADESAP